MGLKSDFKSLAEALIDAFDDIPATCTYHSSGTFSYSPSTGTVNESSPSSISNVKIVFEKYKVDEIDGEQILEDDRKGLIASNDLGVTPQKEDYLVIGSSTYYVKTYSTDPAEALWILQLRV